MYQASVLKIKNVRVHTNADKVLLGTCQGNQVVVGLDTKEDDLGVYFPSDGVLSAEFCKNNNLYRHPELNKNPDAKPGMFDSNGRVRAQKFRGEISDGFFVPFSYFSFLKRSEQELLKEGFDFDTLGKTEICSKYINKETARILRETKAKKTKTAKSSVMFKEHFDTSHFGANVHKFGKGQWLIETEKVHGTSFRVGHVQTDRRLKWYEKFLTTMGVKIDAKTWEYLNGTRRVVIEESSGKQFHDPTIREKAFLLFKDNLRKGETIYGEIVGFESTGAHIMPPADTTKMKDKAFTKQYGEVMAYSYGCAPAQSDVYVYRITFTNEDGHSIDYSWDDVVRRCAELGVKTVPLIRKITFEELALKGILETGKETVDDRDTQAAFVKMVEEDAKGASVIDPRHIKEGVCVRIEGGLNNQTFKFKSFEFKFLEGIIKDSGVVDMEESS